MSKDLGVLRRELPGFKRQYAAEVTGLRELVLSNLAMVAQIPAKTFEEHHRAQFVLERFEQANLAMPHIDEAGNVHAMLKSDSAKHHILLMAHLDTNFDSSVDHNVVMTQKYVQGPGVGNNSLGVAVLISLPDIIRKLGIQLRSDLTLLATTRSQGRGDLSGIRHFTSYNREPLDAALNLVGTTIGRIDHFSLSRVRCDITCVTDSNQMPGDSLGERNAICILSDLLTRLQTIPLPKNPRTVLNIGKFSGGEAYHAPSAKASMSLEVRSEDDHMTERVMSQIKDHCIYVGSKFDVRLHAEFFGRQHASELSFTHPLVKTAYQIVEFLGYKPHMAPSNTEITELLSKGIPAITIGLSTGRHGTLPYGSVDIAPIASGITQLLMLLDAVERGYCDESTRS